jgi:hypothetical protein
MEGRVGGKRGRDIWLFLLGFGLSGKRWTARSVVEMGREEGAQHSHLVEVLFRGRERKDVTTWAELHDILL